MPQTLKQQLEFRLYELKRTVVAFLDFTVDLALLQSIHGKAEQVLQAVDVIQVLLVQDLPNEELI